MVEKKERDALARALLSPEEERAFQGWITSLPWYAEFQQQYGEPPNLNAPEYDYRAAWRAGIVPERSPYDQNRYHWSSSTPEGDMLKSPTHPTAWKEWFMQYSGGIDPDSPQGQRMLQDWR